MLQSAARRHGVRKASLLLVVLAITTGWVQSAAAGHRDIGGDAARVASTAARWTDGAPARPDQAERLLDLGDRAGLAPRRLGFSSVIRFDEHRAEVPTAPIAQADPLVAAPQARTFSGRDRFWIPSLGISYPVQPYECSRRRDPDNFMYRWGCAGTNNVYILGHAWGVMKPLHDAFVAGRLREGMVALYADGNGHIQAFEVTEWRVVEPVEVRWAIASQSVPSMTLQTCVGKDSRYRLNVRLVAID